MRAPRIGILSVVPSPYQRDLFAAMQARGDLDLSIYYLEESAPDSPWPRQKLSAYEKILPGFWFHLGPARSHINWGCPDWKEFDAVICNTMTSYTGQKLMRNLGTTTKWIFWGERLREQNEFLKKKAQQLLTEPLAQSFAIAAVGERASKDYAERIVGPKHLSIPYYCNIRSFEKAASNRKSGTEITFLFCGQMIQRKGIDILLSAFSLLCSQGIKANLLLVGREAELAQNLSIIPVKIRERIRYVGFQPPEKLPEFFAKADVFVLPSRYEGWGVVVNQAIGAGLPVICSEEVGAGVELVEENINGFRIKAGEVMRLVEKMKFVADNKKERERFGKASLKKAKEWTPEKGAEIWARLLHEAVDGK